MSTVIEFLSSIRVYGPRHQQRAPAHKLPPFASARLARNSPYVSLQQYDDCELLWLQYGRQLSLSKSAIYWSLQDVQQGILPCDAELLRERTAAFAALGQQQQVPGLDAMRVLNSSRHALHHEPQLVRERLSQLQQLLPGGPPTQLLLDTLADLDLPPEILALQHQEADAVFQEALGAHVTPAVLHHLLKPWRNQQQEMQHIMPGQQQGTQKGQGQLGDSNVQQWQWPAGQEVMQHQQWSPAPVRTAAAERGAVAATTTLGRLLQQLTALSDVLGPEVVHAAVCSHPELLDAQASQVLTNLQWFQHQLRLSPVAALLLADTAADVLVLPNSVLEARYSNLCYLLLQLLGWRLRQVHTLLCNAPGLLRVDSARLAANWQLVQQLARRRSVWLEELAGGSQGLVVAVLGAEQRQLQQLRYAAETRELQGLGLAQVLRKEYVDFVFACPGFRAWRGLVPAEKQRWSLVEIGRCIVAAGEHHPVKGLPQQRGRVLAVDSKNQPVLIQLGELGPSDRLTG